MSQPRTKLAFSDRELRLLVRSVKTKAGAVRLSIERAKENGGNDWLAFGRSDLPDLRRLAKRLDDAVARTTSERS